MTQPLIPYTVLTSGSDWSAQLANFAFYAPIRDGQTQYLGHTEKIQDDELDDGVSSIKARVNNVVLGLEPKWTSGFTVAIASGAAILPDGTLRTYTGTTVTVPANQTSFIWLNSAGDITVGTQPPAIRKLLASVVAGATQVSAVTDLRNRGLHEISPFAGSIKVFGGNSVVDKTCTQGEQLLAGEYYFRNFTVPAGVTITLSGFTRIICSGNFTVQGTVNLQRASKGGLGFRGTGRANTAYAGFPGQGLGGGAGVNQSSFGTYNYFVTSLSSGGSGSWTEIGASNISGTLTAPRGGDGGGTLIVEAAGAVLVSGTISAEGENGQGHTNILLDGSPYTPGTAASITGGGGGAGGLLWFKSLTSVVFTNTSTLSVRGGNGGTGSNAASFLTAGGGGGGYIVTNAPTVNTTGATLLLNGGTSTVTSGTFGSVPGGSFAGAGGSAGQAGGVGQFLSGGLVPY